MLGRARIKQQSAPIGHATTDRENVGANLRFLPGPQVDYGDRSIVLPD
jgi:hypothetical protein